MSVPTTANLVRKSRLSEHEVISWGEVVQAHMESVANFALCNAYPVRHAHFLTLPGNA